MQNLAVCTDWSTIVWFITEESVLYLEVLSHLEIPFVDGRGWSTFWWQPSGCIGTNADPLYPLCSRDVGCVVNLMEEKTTPQPPACTSFWWWEKPKIHMLLSSPGNQGRIPSSSNVSVPSVNYIDVTPSFNGGKGSSNKNSKSAVVLNWPLDFVPFF